MTETIRVLIADDHEAVRSGVAAILEASQRIEIVGEAENGLAALTACHDAAPDVALIDLRMPGRDGIWATERITAETVTRVLVLTTFDSDDLVSAALAAGAHGFLLKSTSGAELIRAVEHVAAARHVLDPAVAGAVIAGFSRARDSAGVLAEGEGIAGLTDREREVLALVAAGFTNQQISDALHIALTTTKTHVGALYAKSGVRTRVQLAALAAAL